MKQTLNGPGLVLGSLLAVSAVFIAGCVSTTKVPKEYSIKAEPNVTLTKLTMQPDAYRGKVVILGGVILSQRQDPQGRTWALVRNRPLDADYEPHIPVSRDDPEGGEFWILADPKVLPMNHKVWARVTVVGRVSEETVSQLGIESGKRKPPVLTPLYLYAWESLGSYAPVVKNRGDDAQGARQQPSVVTDIKKN